MFEDCYDVVQTHYYISIAAQGWKSWNPLDVKGVQVYGLLQSAAPFEKVFRYLLLSSFVYFFVFEVLGVRGKTTEIYIEVSIAPLSRSLF